MATAVHKHKYWTCTVSTARSFNLNSKTDPGKVAWTFFNKEINLAKLTSSIIVIIAWCSPWQRDESSTWIRNIGSVEHELKITDTTRREPVAIDPRHHVQWSNGILPAEPSGGLQSSDRQRTATTPSMSCNWTKYMFGLEGTWWKSLFVSITQLKIRFARPNWLIHWHKCTQVHTISDWLNPTSIPSAKIINGKNGLASL